ncbi:MAG: TIM barrel protein [Candidatus Micrarchaeota archaeon]|nr:TIM barrel protein [Candidatus Micrarchaeota archaeon]
MRIFIGPAGYPQGATSGAKAVEIVRKLGLNSMEVEFTYGVRMSEKSAKALNDTASKNNVRLSVHAPYYINLCNPEKVDASIRRIIDSCKMAHLMGAKVVVFHAGFYMSLPARTAQERVTEACLRMDEMITDMELDVKLGLETTGKISQFGTLDEIIAICKKVDLCVPVIDWAHIYARNGGKMDCNDVLEKVQHINKGVLHTHFSGIEFGEKGEIRHLEISSSAPPFEEVADAIIKNGPDINIICESPLLERDAIKMREILTKKGCSLAD